VSGKTRIEVVSPTSASSSEPTDHAEIAAIATHAGTTESSVYRKAARTSQASVDGPARTLTRTPARSIAAARACTACITAADSREYAAWMSACCASAASSMFCPPSAISS
jgi:hypothetical protein